MSKLLSDFYQIQSIQPLNEGEYAITLTLNADHCIFDGHFPQQPVTPGVCVIQMLKEITEKIVEKDLFIQQVKQAKFSCLIDPKVCNTLTINLMIKPEEDTAFTILSSVFYQEALAVKLNSRLQII